MAIMKLMLRSASMAYESQYTTPVKEVSPSLVELLVRLLAYRGRLVISRLHRKTKR